MTEEEKIQRAIKVSTAVGMVFGFLYAVIMLLILVMVGVVW